MSILDRAIAFAVTAHAGATRRDGRTPYILHCTETAAIAAILLAAVIFFGIHRRTHRHFPGE